MAYTISDACIGCRACAKICPTGAVSGEKKEQHAIDTPICIECGACGRVCPSEAVTDNFGLALKRISKKSWERPWFDLEKCMSCAICLDTCPTDAIAQNLQRVKNRHPFPFLENEAACMDCGFCALDCPVGAIEMGPRQEMKTPAPETVE